VESDEAKVVRLSDWLAPDDELVPFGPRAYAQTAAREPAERLPDPGSGAEPPAAAGFWDGDTSVHTAVPGPGIFDEPGERTAEPRRYQRRSLAWRPALPPVHPFGWDSRPRERFADLVDRISWRWAAGGATFVALAVIVIVVALGDSSSGHRTIAAQAGIGNQSLPALSGTLGETGTAAGAASLTDLRRLPPVDAAGRTIGAAAERAGALHARRRPRVVAASVSQPSSSTGGSVDVPTTPAPTDTTPPPTETAPAQTNSTPTPTTGGGGSSSGGNPSSSSSGSNTPAFGSGGSLGPGSSPDS
jgi:hypothetical protein